MTRDVMLLGLGAHFELWDAATPVSYTHLDVYKRQADDLRAGKLVRLFDQVLPNDYSYWLVSSRTAAQRPDAQAFRAWLLEEARRSRLSPALAKR